MRILGSHKRSDPSRVLVQAGWHDASVQAPDAQFFICNLQPDSITVADMPTTGKTLSWLRRVIVSPASAGKAFDSTQSDEFVALPQCVIDAVQNTYAKHGHVDQYTIQYNGHGMKFRLQRVRTGYCIVCERRHDSENAYLKLRANSRLSLHCYRSESAAGVDVSALDFTDIIKLEDAVGLHQLRDAASLAADTTYDTPFVKDSNLLSSPEHVKFVDGKFVVTKQPLPSLMICSSTGSGKTAFVERLIRGNKGAKVIVVSCRRTLASSLSKRLGFANYQDVPNGMIAENRVVVQAESLYRLDLKYYGEDAILILDEFSSLCEQMCSTTTMGDKHGLNSKMLQEYIRSATRVIGLDADLGNSEVALVKSLRSDVHVIHNTFRSQVGDQLVMYESESLLLVKMLELLKVGKRVWITSTLSANATVALHQQLFSQKFRGASVTKNTPESDKRDIAANINSTIANLDYFIHTPTISGHFAKAEPIVKSQKEKLAAIEEERQRQIPNAPELTREAFMDLCEASELTAADKHAMHKFALMEAYDVPAGSGHIVTPQWVKMYDSDQEKAIYKNIRALSEPSGATTQDRMRFLRQQEQLSSQCSIETKSSTQTLHKLANSQFIKLSYAVDIMDRCGSRIHLPATRCHSRCSRTVSMRCGAAS
ncbi:hypothetical protein BGZ98_007577 [Dissophora globulifera]|nr:hypothetical protein BGZ98_007577 [Dissophora globulifera]